MYAAAEFASGMGAVGDHALDVGTVNQADACPAPQVPAPVAPCVRSVAGKSLHRWSRTSAGFGGFPVEAIPKTHSSADESRAMRGCCSDWRPHRRRHSGSARPGC